MDNAAKVRRTKSLQTKLNGPSGRGPGRPAKGVDTLSTPSVQADSENHEAQPEVRAVRKPTTTNAC